MNRLRLTDLKIRTSKETIGRENGFKTFHLAMVTVTDLAGVRCVVRFGGRDVEIGDRRRLREGRWGRALK